MTGRELALVYQPIRDLRDGRVVGAEALLRWYHPRRGVIPPDEFLARRRGDRADGRHRRAGCCRRRVRRRPSGSVRCRPGRRSPSRSTSPVASSAPTRSSTVAEALRTTGLRPGTLVLELTESVLISRTTEAVELLTQLKQLGVSIAVDDFGTGYSSLSYLSRYPVDLLKIDRSFTEQVTRADSWRRARTHDRAAGAQPRACVPSPKASRPRRSWRRSGSWAAIWRRATSSPGRVRPAASWS